MAYRDKKAYDFRLVTTNANQALTIDLGKEFSGTITAFMKTDPSSDHYREFSVDETGRYISLSQSQTVDLVDGDTTYEIAGRWYVNVWQKADDDSDRVLIYTGKILFLAQIDSYLSSDAGEAVTENIIYSFQFDDATLDIDDVDSLDSSDFIEYSEEDMTEGQDITLTNVGRYGFKVEGDEEADYTIENELSADITDHFNKTYSDGVTYYVSQEIAIPSTIYFKFS